MMYFLGLGSNLARRSANLARARRLLEEAGLAVVQASSVYETEPVDLPGQPLFLNQVLEVRAEIDPPAMLRLAKSVETALKRVPTVAKGPRTIDVDILLAGDSVIETADLVVPHPRLHLRNFVLVPLAEIASGPGTRPWGRRSGSSGAASPDQARVVKFGRRRRLTAGLSAGRGRNPACPASIHLEDASMRFKPLLLALLLLCVFAVAQAAEVRGKIVSHGTESRRGGRRPPSPERDQGGDRRRGGSSSSTCPTPSATSSRSSIPISTSGSSWSGAGSPARPSSSRSSRSSSRARRSWSRPCAIPSPPSTSRPRAPSSRARRSPKSSPRISTRPSRTSRAWAPSARPDSRSFLPSGAWPAAASSTSSTARGSRATAGRGPTPPSSVPTTSSGSRCCGAPPPFSTVPTPSAASSTS